MRRLDQVLVVLSVAAMILVAATVWVPHWPGDITITRFVQGLSPDTTWAETVTKSASRPWSLGLVAVAGAIAWWLAGWRAAIVVALAFGSMWWLGDWVKPLVGRPRPSPDLVRVTGSPRGLSFPSTFALIYATTVGALALIAAYWSRRRGRGAMWQRLSRSWWSVASRGSRSARTGPVTFSCRTWSASSGLPSSSA